MLLLMNHQNRSLSLKANNLKSRKVKDKEISLEKKQPKAKKKVKRGRERLLEAKKENTKHQSSKPLTMQDQKTTMSLTKKIQSRVKDHTKKETA
jgi:hypothetical protein